ncbi:MAG: DUF4832 domain-containing protein [Chitinophagaceae bacterium]|nr:DUF4832 domain-containing protein [Chitinophagaceae bacterium]
MMRTIVLVVISFFIFFHVAQSQVLLTYTESNADFPNPERGFYIPSETQGGKAGVLNGNILQLNRTNLQKHGKATYAIYSTLLFRNYLLAEFVNKPISAAFLTQIDNDMAVVRRTGIKMILRFSYTNKPHGGDCADKEHICPPYGDAPKNIVLEHISQLQPLLRKNADVIAVVQQGFIGIWGENYYTDYFGDASENGAGKILDSNWTDRNEVLKALLDALPEDRMVQVRTPQMKQKFIYGPGAGTRIPAITAKDALTRSYKSRVGFHNDCFLASADDYGTFYDYGSSSSPKKEANKRMRTYFETDSRYVAVGGETCDDAFSPQNDCAPAGHAEQEMAAMHYSYLNTAYNNLVNNDWDSLGCMENIKKNLGYRFVLQEAVLPAVLQKNASLNCVLKLVNKGYAAPFNARPVELILRHSNSKKVYVLRSTANAQFWYPGNITVNEAFVLPKEVQPGKYELLLSLPDKYASLYGRSEYSIRLANENTWEQATGFNNLNHIISVTE